MPGDAIRFATLLLACVFVAACSRAERPYGARLTYDELVATFRLANPSAYPLRIAATPENPRQLLTVQIDIQQRVLLVYSDLERQDEVARIPFSTRHGLWSVTIQSPAFTREIRMEAPDSETLIAPHDIEFKS